MTTELPDRFVIFCLGKTGAAHSREDLYIRHLDVANEIIRPVPKKPLGTGDARYIFDRLEHTEIRCTRAECTSVRRMPDLELNRLIVGFARVGKLEMELNRIGKA